MVSEVSVLGFITFWLMVRQKHHGRDIKEEEHGGQKLTARKQGA
jgi:hypothetical protein